MRGISHLYGKERKNIAETSNSSRQSSSTSSVVSNDIVVGIDDELHNIRDRLTGYPPRLDIVSIVGMGGIGKTTLARKAYDDPIIADYFHIWAWTTLSQEYNLSDVLLGLLHQVCQFDCLKNKALENSREIGAELFRELLGRRYLVVIDDIWDVEAWQKLRIFFPNDCNGSRILLTSRDVNVGKYANPNLPPLELSLMNPETSWELLSKKVFVRDCCPESLIPIGKSIAEKCHGLPLAINLVAGHLCSVGRTCLDWLNVERQIPSLQENGLPILALSYNYLPQHLKLCLLFTAYEYGQFYKKIQPQALLHKITASPRPEINQNLGMPTQKLMRLWIAAGFITADSVRNLEDVAEDCLHELTSRNLVMVTKMGSSGRPKRCIVHDLIIEMCRRLDASRVGRIGNSSDELYHFALFGDIDTTDNLLQSIEDNSNSKIKDLRYLEISTSSIPPSVFKFCNLQTFINQHPFPGETLPRDVWMMSQLRHLHVGDSCYLQSPKRPLTQEASNPILKNLQSVTLSSASCTREVCEGMPNLRRLKLFDMGTERIAEEQSLNCLNNIYFLEQLQSLTMSLRNLPQCLSHWQNPPPNLKRLTLARCSLSGRHISMLASLSNLEVLKLVNIDLHEGVLEHDDKIFHKLRYLLLNCRNFRLWKVDGINLPSLQHLVLKDCINLYEIPLEIGEVPTLEVIELHNCSSSSQLSAKEIELEQWEIGNDDFMVQVTHSLNFPPVPLKVSSLKVGSQKSNLSSLSRTCSL